MSIIKIIGTKVAKWFIPGASKLAGYAAEGIAKAVNSSKDDTKAKVGKVAAAAETATNVANQLARMLNDGTINAAEEKELQAMLTPMFAKVLELI